MISSKWIVGVNASTPLVEAVPHVLQQRFEIVSHYLPLIVAPNVADLENVHQLRVATRRANAALRIFGDVIPDSVGGDARKLLRRFRRAAGEARDWDVFHIDVTDAMKAGLLPAEAGALLLGYALACRAQVQTNLREVVESYQGRWLLVSDSLTSKCASNTEHALGDLGISHIRVCLYEFESAALLLPTVVEELHAIRIIGKRLRYSMEVFAECFADPFRNALYPAIEEAQSILGSINDCTNIAQRLTQITNEFKNHQSEHHSRLRAGLDQWRKAQTKRVGIEKRRFGKWWARWQKLRAKHPLESLQITPRAE